MCGRGMVQFELSKTVLPPHGSDGFTPRRKARKGRKEGQSEAPLSPLRSLRALRLGVKPCRKPAGKFKLYPYRRRRARRGSDVRRGGGRKMESRPLPLGEGCSFQSWSLVWPGLKKVGRRRKRPLTRPVTAGESAVAGHPLPLGEGGVAKAVVTSVGFRCILCTAKNNRVHQRRRAGADPGLWGLRFPEFLRFSSPWDNLGATRGRS
jgi:hypothetical protein